MWPDVEMKQPKTPEEQILAAIAGLGDRMSRLETLGNDLVVGHMENAALIEALIEAVKAAPQVLLGGVAVEPPDDLALNTWIEDQKKKG